MASAIPASSKRTSIPWWASPTTKPKPTASGPAGDCRRKRNGRRPPAGTKRSSTPIPGRGAIRGIRRSATTPRTTILPPAATSESKRAGGQLSAREPVPTGAWIWSAMPMNGSPIGTRPIRAIPSRSITPTPFVASKARAGMTVPPRPLCEPDLVSSAQQQRHGPRRQRLHRLPRRPLTNRLEAYPTAGQSSILTNWASSNQTRSASRDWPRVASMTTR